MRKAEVLGARPLRGGELRDVDRYAKATLVGEPTGGGVNTYGFAGRDPVLERALRAL